MPDETETKGLIETQASTVLSLADFYERNKGTMSPEAILSVWMAMRDTSLEQSAVDPQQETSGKILLII